MKDKINYSNCMRIKCRDCKNYDFCFGYRPNKRNEKDETKIEGYKEPIKKTAKLQPLVMKNFISDWS